MKYLRRFEAAEDVAMDVIPNVVLVGDTGAVLYNAPIVGVYIQHINGKLYTTDEWVSKEFANEQANGVAVGATVDGTTVSFVIAKTGFDKMPWSSDAVTNISGIMSTSTETIAKTDYAGAANTELMLTSDTSGAAYTCANFIFPNGKKGYLPAFGEWCVVFSLRELINRALNLIGGTPLHYSTGQNSSLWSSTQYSSSKAWAMKLYSGGGLYYDKSASAYLVRPFCTL